MTYAPKTLLEARAVVRQHTGLTTVEVGITPDPAHNGGYHCGWDQRRIVSGSLRDYSWTESPRDSNHKTSAASALDIGWFTQLADGRKLSLIDFNLWLVHELNLGAPDTLDIREFIYTPDGKVVKRWDRLNKRDTGDSSHLQHSHISRFRDAENNPLAPLMRRFFEKGSTMEQAQKDDLTAITNRVLALLSGTDARYHVSWTPEERHEINEEWKKLQEILAKLDTMDAKLDAIVAKLDTLGPIPDSVEIVSGHLEFGKPV